MKKIKRMLIGSLLVFTLCILTACGKSNNAADEVPDNKNQEKSLFLLPAWMWDRGMELCCELLRISAF